jgi:hypothetical protein
MEPSRELPFPSIVVREIGSINTLDPELAFIPIHRYSSLDRSRNPREELPFPSVLFVRVVGSINIIGSWTGIPFIEPIVASLDVHGTIARELPFPSGVVKLYLGPSTSLDPELASHLSEPSLW